jgi:hypothetical protein
LERWRIRRQLRKLKPKRTCTDCGFLAFGDVEVDLEDRIRLDSEMGNREPVDNWRCARNLWDWGLHYSVMNWDALRGEVVADRRGCTGFMKWNPGHTPTQHFQLMKESADFRRKLLLGLLPLLYGSIGALVTWLVTRQR